MHGIFTSSLSVRWWWSSFPFGSFGLSSRLFSSEMISLVAGRKKVNEHAMKYDLPSRSSPFTNTVFLGSFDMEGRGGWVQIAMKRDFRVQDHLRISRRSQSMTRESGWPNYSSNIFRKSIADLESVEIAKRDTSLISKFIGFCMLPQSNYALIVRDQWDGTAKSIDCTRMKNKLLRAKNNKGTILLPLFAIVNTPASIIE